NDKFMNSLSHERMTSLSQVSSSSSISKAAQGRSSKGGSYEDHHLSDHCQCHPVLRWIGYGGQRGHTAHVIAPFNEATWGPAPPMLPPGAQIAVLAGDPTSSTAYAVRLKFPANYAMPAHSHPTDENVVVVSEAVTFAA